MKKQTKVARTKKLDPRQILGLRVKLPSPVKVFSKALQQEIECTSGTVGKYLGSDNYVVGVKGNELQYKGKDLVDGVIC